MERTTSLAPLGRRVWVLACLAVGAAPLAAQVGHPPSSSPYRDIRRGHTLTLTGGYFSGDGGDFNIGPQDGPVYGVRYDIRTSRTVQLGFGVARGNLQRFIINPFVPLANRRTGPVDQSVTFLDVNVQMNVTGGKSWHRIAPYVQLTGGLALAGETPADTSQFDFGNKLYFAPSGGLRLFLTQRLHLRAEARATFWKLNYPITFQTEPEPGTPAVITGTGRTEWVTSSWLQAGVGYSFSP
jgi:hypothetical protein